MYNKYPTTTINCRITLKITSYQLVESIINYVASACQSEETKQRLARVYIAFPTKD